MTVCDTGTLYFRTFNIVDTCITYALIRYAYNILCIRMICFVYNTHMIRVFIGYASRIILYDTRMIRKKKCYTRAISGIYGIYTSGPVIRGPHKIDFVHRSRTCSIRETTKRGPQVRGLPLWTWSVDYLRGPLSWTTLVDHSRGPLSWTTCETPDFWGLNS
jgi:hypothetical protein